MKKKLYKYNLDRDFPTFLKLGPGPVEFGKIVIKSSKLGKLDSVKIKKRRTEIGML